MDSKWDKCLLVLIIPSKCKTITSSSIQQTPKLTSLNSQSSLLKRNPIHSPQITTLTHPQLGLLLIMARLTISSRTLMRQLQPLISLRILTNLIRPASIYRPTISTMEMRNNSNVKVILSLNLPMIPPKITPIMEQHIRLQQLKTVK